MNLICGKYKIGKTIGEGTFGKVKFATNITSSEIVAIKILQKDKIKDKDDYERINREIKFLKKLKHINIIKIIEISENFKNYFIVMEYITQGELFNYIVQNRRLELAEASFFFFQIINGLEYIHTNNITHRDLKPENLLIGKNKILKIIDFGLSNHNSNSLSTPCGSPCYAAPEMIIGKKYSGACVDIWSSGIILYAMICGYLPFDDKDNNKLYKKILQCKIEFPDFVSNDCKDLIISILNVNPGERFTIQDIKGHKFYKFGEKVAREENLYRNVEIDLHNYTGNFSATAVTRINNVNINIDCVENIGNININFNNRENANSNEGFKLDMIGKNGYNNTTPLLTCSPKITTPLKHSKVVYNIKNELKLKKVDFLFKSLNMESILNGYKNRRISSQRKLIFTKNAKIITNFKNTGILNTELITPKILKKTEILFSPEKNQTSTKPLITSTVSFNNSSDKSSFPLGIHKYNSQNFTRKLKNFCHDNKLLYSEINHNLIELKKDKTNILGIELIDRESLKLFKIKGFDMIISNLVQNLSKIFN